MRLRRKTQRERPHLLAEEDAEGGDAEGDEEGLPVVGLDYAYYGNKDDDEGKVTLIIAKDARSGVSLG